MLSFHSFFELVMIFSIEITHSRIKNKRVYIHPVMSIARIQSSSNCTDVVPEEAYRVAHKHKLKMHPETNGFWTNFPILLCP